MTQAPILGGPPVPASRFSVSLRQIRFNVLHWPPAGDGYGRGRHVVLLHGLQGNAATQGRLASWLAAEGWNAFALDLPGHGGTEWLDLSGTPVVDAETIDRRVYRLETVAELTAAAVAALGLPRPPLLIGHSWGAGVAVGAILARAPVKRAVLIDPPFMTPAATESLIAELESSLRTTVESATELLTDAYPDWDPYDLQATAEALTQASPLAISGAAAENAGGAYRVLRRWLLVRPSTRVDLIVGNPAHGGLVPPRARLLLRIALGRGHVHYMPQAGHGPQFSHPADFLALLARILEIP